MQRTEEVAVSPIASGAKGPEREVTQMAWACAVKAVKGHDRRGGGALLTCSQSPFVPTAADGPQPRPRMGIVWEEPGLEELGPPKGSGTSSEFSTGLALLTFLTIRVRSCAAVLTMNIKSVPVRCRWGDDALHHYWLFCLTIACVSLHYICFISVLHVRSSKITARTSALYWGTIVSPWPKSHGDEGWRKSGGRRPAAFCGQETRTSMGAWWRRAEDTTLCAGAVGLLLNALCVGASSTTCALSCVVRRRL